MGKSIHDCLLEITRRAERATDEKLTETFVDAEPLLASVSTPDNQVIFGRRGTGKTHVLKYLNRSKSAAGDVAVFLDLRAIGSNGSIYSDQSKTITQRATPLLLDILQELHEQLLTVAINLAEELDLSRIGPKLDNLADSISEVQVVGPVEFSSERTKEIGRQSREGMQVGFTPSGAAASVQMSDDVKEAAGSRTAITRSGAETYYVNFGSIQNRLRAVLELLGGRRVWLLLDEWSEIPIDLQPYLADLLRRCVIPLASLTVKIAAIEHRTNLILRYEREYVGMELGADVGADLNLDDFMVFENDARRAMRFFASLLFKHYRATDGLASDEGPQSADEFINQLFTQRPAFEEFVRATEGVPRDAVYLASGLARIAYNRPVSTEDVRKAARDWFQRDKMTILKSSPELSDLLHWIMEEVIQHRRARAFLLESTQRHDLIDILFDHRLLHVLKKNISSHDTPGVRYDVYKLDYGCYVNLIATAKAPGGLLPTDEAGFVEVPPDDYRAIRRAILNISQFESAKQAGKSV